MSDKENMIEIQLNAFIDGELDDNEKAEILNLINEKPELAKIVSETRQDMDLISLAYRNLEVKGSFKEYIATKTSILWRYAAVAASLFLVIGITGGWLASGYKVQTINPAFSLVEDYNPTTSTANKILIHVSSMDKATSALEKLEETLKMSDKSSSNVQLKLIATTEGLAVLRHGSPYAAKIRSLSNQYKNLEFLACGIAMETARLKEQKDIMLLPEARKVPAALTEIIEKLEAGWLYVRS